MIAVWLGEKSAGKMAATGLLPGGEGCRRDGDWIAVWEQERWRLDCCVDAMLLAEDAV